MIICVRKNLSTLIISILCNIFNDTTYYWKNTERKCACSSYLYGRNLQEIVFNNLFYALNFLSVIKMHIHAIFSVFFTKYLGAKRWTDRANMGDFVNVPFLLSFLCATPRKLFKSKAFLLSMRTQATNK